MEAETPVFGLFVVDKRKSPNYQELRGFIPKTLSLKFKGICKGLGWEINEGLEEAIQDWIEKQQRQQEAAPYESAEAKTAIVPPVVPTIATLIEETLSNRNWVLKKFAADTEIPIERINELLKGDRPSDLELQQFAQRLVKPNGDVWEEEELVDIRLAEDLKRRQQQRRSR